MHKENSLIISSTSFLANPPILKGTEPIPTLNLKVHLAVEASINQLSSGNPSITSATTVYSTWQDIPACHNSGELFVIGRFTNSLLGLFLDPVSQFPYDSPKDG